MSDPKPAAFSEIPAAPLRKLVEARRHMRVAGSRVRWDSLARELNGASVTAGLVDFECKPFKEEPGLFCEWSERGEWRRAEIRDIEAEIAESILVVREVLET